MGIRGVIVSMARRKAVQQDQSSLSVPAQDLARLQGVTPLEILARVMQGDNTITPLQFEAAKAVAPYLHARLATVQMRATLQRSVEDMTDEELAALARHSGRSPKSTR